MALTTNQNDDAEGGREVIKQIKEPIACVVGDGAYDKRTFRGCLPRGIPQIIPPRRDARDLKGKVPEYDQRDQVVRRIKNTSRTEWKKEVGYHIRSKSEVNMYRYKVTFGERMSSRKLAFEKTEVLIKAKILNQFVSLGMPKSYKVA